VGKTVTDESWGGIQQFRGQLSRGLRSLFVEELAEKSSRIDGKKRRREALYGKKMPGPG